MSNYRQRIVDEILSERIGSAGAVVLEGPKWCGKTTTCEQIAKSCIYLTDPDRREQYLQIAQTEISNLLAGDSPRLIDEWQDIPQIWDAVRHTVDRSGGERHFILTGSSVVSPKKRKQIRHSGTGRFSWIKMRPMSLWESGESSGEVSLRDLFDRPDEFTSAKAQERKLKDMAFIICRGGWPLSVGKSGSAALRHAKDYYIAVTESDISRYDDVPRDPMRVRAIMKSYARLQGTQSNLSAIRKDIVANESQSTSEDTIASYLKALKGIFVVEEMPAWCPELRSKDSVRTSDTRFFVDPSIAAVALGTTPNGLMDDLRSYGYFFEALAVRDLRTYMDAMDGRVMRYHDKTGLECDAVMQSWDGSYALAEVKLGGGSLIEEGAGALNKLCSLIENRGILPPRFLMVVTAVGEFAYRRKEDGVIVCPISCLKP